ncbi:MAG: DinB family protein [Rhodothermaceae bacterium]|nr:DinB family protein [Rhodothermaceae bacterium]
MSEHTFDPQQLLSNALSATGVHIDPQDILDGLVWNISGVTPNGFPHSIFQIVNHVIYWQDLFLSGLEATKMAGPKHAEEGWPGEKEPKSMSEWDELVERYKASLKHASTEIKSKNPLLNVPAAESTKRIDILNAYALHVSYHAGQIVLIRRVLGAWPPPGGGHTW